MIVNDTGIPGTGTETEPPGDPNAAWKNLSWWKKLLINVPIFVRTSGAYIDEEGDFTGENNTPPVRGGIGTGSLVLVFIATGAALWFMGSRRK